MQDGDGRRIVGLAIGGLGAVGVAIALVPFRTTLDNANLALILVLVVVLAAIIGGRGAALIGALAATMALDFFLIRPYTSMRIESADDIETIVIFLAVGLLVGEVAERGRRSRRQRERAGEAIARVHRVAAHIAEGGPVEESVALVLREVAALLQLHDCRLELAPFQWPLPSLERSGTIEGDEHQFSVTGSGAGFAIPEYGVQLLVLEAGQEVARLVLIGNPEVAVTLEERVIAVALADQLGAVLARAAPDELRRIAEAG